MEVEADNNTRYQKLFVSKEPERGHAQFLSPVNLEVSDAAVLYAMQRTSL